MADIDKGLPNTRSQIEIPSEEELQEVAVQDENIEELKGPVEVIPEEDGGATIDYDPGAINTAGSQSHFDNLADILPEDVVEPIGNEMVQNYMDYKSSRKEWESAYTSGLDLLGFKYENRTEPFQGASGATHPVLAEAVTQFQAQAYKELLPSDGPVRTQVIGVKNPQTEQQAGRVKDYMNYLIMNTMKDNECDIMQDKSQPVEDDYYMRGLILLDLETMERKVISRGTAEDGVRSAGWLNNDRIWYRPRYKQGQGIKSIAVFAVNLDGSKKRLIRKLKNYKKRKLKIAGYAATSKSTTILNYCKIGTNYIDYISDTTKEKIGKYSPGTHIPIVSMKHFYKNSLNSIFLFAWNHKKEIFKKEKKIVKRSNWFAHVKL